MTPMGAPAAVIIEWHHGQPRLSWPSTPGHSYRVEFGSALSRDRWAAAVTVEAAGPLTSWTDADAGAASRFYRLAYEVPALVSEVSFTHLDRPNGIPDLVGATFASVRDRMRQMAVGGVVSLPVPVPELAVFDSLTLAEALVFIDDVQRAIAISGNTTVQGQSVAVMVVASWGNDTGAAHGFSFGFKFPEFRIGDWVGGLADTAIADLAWDGSVVSLATAPMTLDLTGFPGNAQAFYRSPTLAVAPGLNLHHLIDVAQSSRLTPSLDRLGVTETNALLEGFLDLHPNRLFRATGPVAAPGLHLRAHLPVTQPNAFPGWLRPVERILEFRNEPALHIRLTDVLAASPDGQSTRFLASTEIDATGGQVAATLRGHWSSHGCDRSGSSG